MTDNTGINVRNCVVNFTKQAKKLRDDAFVMVKSAERLESAALELEDAIDRDRKRDGQLKGVETITTKENK